MHGPLQYVMEHHGAEDEHAQHVRAHPVRTVLILITVDNVMQHHLSTKQARVITLYSNLHHSIHSPVTIQVTDYACVINPHNINMGWLASVFRIKVPLIIEPRAL